MALFFKSSMYCSQQSNIEPVKDEYVSDHFCFLYRLTRDTFKEVSKNMKTILEKCLPVDLNSSDFLFVNCLSRISDITKVSPLNSTGCFTVCHLCTCMKSALKSSQLRNLHRACKRAP